MAASILGGLSTIVYVLVVRFGSRFIVIVIALHVAISAALARAFGPLGAA